MSEQQSPEDAKLTEELMTLHHKLTHYREYSLESGKWNAESVIALVEIRREAADKVTEALKRGFQRNSAAEVVLIDLGITPAYPAF